MIILSESSPQLPASASADALRNLTESAKLLGIRVYHILQDFRDMAADEALAYLPEFAEAETAFWIGYIPAPDRYQAVYEALIKKNIWLVNTPDEFQRAEEFDRYYPLIEELTCQSRVTGSLEEARQAASALGYPVFLKGTIQSLKQDGWQSCVAENEAELETIFLKLEKQVSRSLGKVIVRELINLKYDTQHHGFPQAREFRVFLLKNKVVGYSYYWDKDNTLSHLLPEEEKIVWTLAQTASRQINTPYLAVDVGQRMTGDWLVIEAGDAQFSGIRHLSPLQLWQHILNFTQ